MSNKENELSEDVIERLDKMKQDIIEEMVERGWDRKKAEAQAEAFS